MRAALPACQRGAAGTQRGCAQPVAPLPSPAVSRASSPRGKGASGQDAPLSSPLSSPPLLPSSPGRASPPPARRSALTLSPTLAGHAPAPQPRPFVLGPALLPEALRPPASVPPRRPPQEPLQASPWDRAAAARPPAPKGRLALAAVREAERVKPATGEAPPGRPHRGGRTGEASPRSPPGRRQSPARPRPLRHTSGRQHRGPGAICWLHGRKRGAGRGPCCGGGGTAGAGSTHGVLAPHCGGSPTAVGTDREGCSGVLGLWVGGWGRAPSHLGNTARGFQPLPTSVPWGEVVAALRGRELSPQHVAQARGGHREDAGP